MKFRLWCNFKGTWYWTLVAKNGEPIAQSEGYKTEQGARKGIRSIRTVAPFAKIDKLMNAEVPDGTR
jgi:uncharacterized protein YegP (UPF0339 family)